MSFFPSLSTTIYTHDVTLRIDMRINKGERRKLSSVNAIISTNFGNEHVLKLSIRSLQI